VFPAAAAAVRAKPQRCMVIEDSLFDVYAARAEWMSCLATRSTSPPGRVKINVPLIGLLSVPPAKAGTSSRVAILA
jgi:beta-phosphoglucomutase-like phosphatase (HAD superfamily)